MRELPRISGVRFRRARHEDRRRGLLGWVGITFGDALRLDAIAVRKTREGTLTLAFPRKLDPAGSPHPIVRPLDQSARQAIEARVIGELRRGGWL